MPEIPPEIITVILSFSPPKSLLRFRCVSKRWCSEIDSPAFIKLYLNRSIQTKSNLSFIFNVTGPGSLHSLDFNTLHKALKLQTPINNPVLLGSCHGLILLSGSNINASGTNLTLYNPTTRTQKPIPVCPIFSPHLSGSKPKGGYFLLGFDAVNDDYKIISIMEFVDEETWNWVYSNTQIYSLKSNQWKGMKAFPCKLPLIKQVSVYVGGRFHTLVSRNANGTDAILVTDIAKEDHSFMELPSFVHNGAIRMSLDSLGVGEFLCLQLVYKGFRTEVWVMKEYGVMSSWNKLMCVAPPVLPPLTPLDALTYSKDSNKVLFSVGESKLCWYDLNREIFDHVPVRDLPKDYAYVDVCVGSLVRLNAQHKNMTEGAKMKKKRDDFLSKGFKLKL